MKLLIAAFKVRPSLGVLLALAASFLAGHVSAATPFATSINKGLANAFASVGQNLFGAAAFDTTYVPPNPVFPAGSLQLYLAEDVAIGTGLNVFVPPNPVAPDPCRVAMQIRAVPPNPTAPNGIQIVVDPDVAPDGTDIVFESLSAYRPSVDRCVAGPVDNPPMDQ